MVRVAATATRISDVATRAQSVREVPARRQVPLEIARELSLTSAFESPSKTRERRACAPRAVGKQRRQRRGNLCMKTNAACVNMLKPSPF